MRRSAYTMIELIFVIIILAILAAVSIPKLAATRTNAKASSKAHSIMVGAAEIASYAVSRGETKSDLSEMSNSITYLVNSGEAVLDIANNRATISTNTISDCVSIQIFENSTDNNLTIIFGNANSDKECTMIQSLIDEDAYPMQLRGMKVVY